MKVHDNLMKIYETLGKGDEIMQIYRGPEVVECIRLPSDFWYIRPRFEKGIVLQGAWEISRKIYKAKR